VFAYGCGPCPPGNISATLCVPDAGTPDADAGAADAAPLDPNSAEEGLYIATCITSISSQDPAKVLRFYTTVTKDPKQKGAFGLSLKPMKGWDTSVGGSGAPVPPASVSVSETLGTPVNSNNVVPNSGKFVAPLGEFTIPAAANSLGGSEMVLNANLNGSLAGGRLSCAILSGSVSKPIPVPLTGDREVCLFKKVNEGAVVPTYTPAQFVCP